MRAGWSRRICASIAACGVVCIASHVAAESEGADELDHWVPSLGIWSGIHFEWAEANVRSRTLPAAVYVDANPQQFPNGRRCIDNCFFPTGDETGVRPNKFGDDFLVVPYMGGGLELMTPGLTHLPGSPRLFGHFGASYAFGGERDIAKEGDPGVLTASPTEPGAPEFAVLNQGSRTSVELKSPILTAGIGVAFSFDVFDRRVRVKPSIEYMYEDLDVSGIVARAWRSEEGNALNPFIPPEFQRVQFIGNKRQVFHMLGPGIELEMDAARTGPFLVAIFIEANAYRVLNERGVSFEASAPGIDFQTITLGPPGTPPTITDFSTGPQQAAWNFRKARWAFGTGVGFRIRLSPE